VNPYDMPGGVIYRPGGPAKLVSPSTSGPTYAAPARRSSRSLGGSLPSGYRAACSFVINGRPVAQGEILKRDDPLVPIVLVQRPELLVGVPAQTGGLNA
jgi:hypothetical protein